MSAKTTKAKTTAFTAMTGIPSAIATASWMTRRARDDVTSPTTTTYVKSSIVSVNESGSDRRRDTAARRRIYRTIPMGTNSPMETSAATAVAAAADHHAGSPRRRSHAPSGVSR